MKKIEVDVVDDILKSRMALHDFGRPVKAFLSEKVGVIDAPTLLIINLRKVNPMDYEFVNIAFFDVVNKYKSEPRFYIAFKVNKWELEELYTGILDILSIKIQAPDDEYETLRKNQFTLTIIDENDTPKYLSQLSQQHLDVLTEIEKKSGISSKEIQDKFSLNAEDTTRVLSDLNTSKFIYTIEGPKYSSVKSLI